MGQIIANMGDVLKIELIVCFPIFLERLRNEVTRLSAVKALTMIAASSLHIDMSPILVRIFYNYLFYSLKIHSIILFLHISCEHRMMQFLL